MTKLPLEGIRVVEICIVWAGPFARKLLADMGAEVIHLDPISHLPDFGRGFFAWPTRTQLEARDVNVFPNSDPGAEPWNRNAGYNRYFWNVLSCSMDLAKPEGKEVFKRLIAKTDVFIENGSAVAMEHLDLGHEVLMEINPRLICINFPSYGRSGKYKDYVGWGDNAEAVAGHHWVRGYPDETHPASNTVAFQMDSSGGAFTALAALMGLWHRERTGKGQWVDFAQIESVLPQMGEIFMDYAWNGRNQRTIGNRHPTAVQGCYLCRGPEPSADVVDKFPYYGEDKWVNITINNDEEWQGLCNAMGNPEWTRDEKFADALSRYKNHDEFDENIGKWTRQHDNFWVFQTLQAYGVPAGPVEDWRDTYNDPQLNARGFFQTITSKWTGTHRYPGFLWNYPETPMSVRRPPAGYGEDNDYVYKQVIGMSDGEIAELTKKEVIGIVNEECPYTKAGPKPDYLPRKR